MYNITLPDGAVLNFAAPVTGFEIASKISKSLAKNAIAMTVDSKERDLSHTIARDASVSIITKASDAGLEIIRHDAAHLLAAAVKELFPETGVTIGPVIENGFYYDFVRDKPFTEADFGVIETKMLELSRANFPIERKVLSRADAIKFFEDMGEHYKVEIIKAIPDGEELSVYFQEDFADLCRGPHAPSTNFVKHFKLIKVSGAYWRGDSNNRMLQRIYGTAWRTEAELKEYLTMMEEAEKRDHRKLGKLLSLFHFQIESPGTVFWHPRGWFAFNQIVAYMRCMQDRAGYLEINTPELLDRSLWEASGHWEKFADNMLIAESVDDKRTLAVKPMSCPGCIQVYNSSLHSYRDLPLLLSEFGKVYRNEPSGSLHGLFRLRSFTQDDAHIFCTHEQLLDECVKVCNFVTEVYSAFGFDSVKVKFSDRPEMRVGSDDIWDLAEEKLMQALITTGAEYTINEGEGAFYGPKLEFVLKDTIGRDWQLATLQLDFNLPDRLGVYYIDSDGQKKHPAMLHRAIFGSIERFLGILIEHTAGILPQWMCFTQVVVATISDAHIPYAKGVLKALKDAGVRADGSFDNQKISYKVREAMEQKHQVVAVIGNAEQEAGSVSVRRIGSGEQVGMVLDDFVQLMQRECASPMDKLLRKRYGGEHNG